MIPDLTHLSLFAGIGGLDLAAEWAGFRTIGQVEKNPYCTKVLERHWPNVARWGDIRDVRGDTIQATVVSGGFPCQPFSVAGKRRGTDDDRYLWPEMLRVIREVSPRWVVAENVYGLVSYDGGLVLRQVYVDLEAEGYETMPPVVLPACGVGAPHRRYRVFIVAHNPSIGRGARGTESKGQQGRPGATFGSSDVADAETSAEWAGLCQSGQTGERGGRFGDGGGKADVANSLGAGSRVRRGSRACGVGRCTARGPTDGHSTPASTEHGAVPVADALRCGRWPDDEGQAPTERDGHPGAGWWAVEPDICRVANGIPSRVDRLRGLGNAVVPQQAYPLFATIARMEGLTQ